MELTVGLAFIAGLVSFLSPCVLPLVPAYVGYMGGRMTNSVATSMRTGGARSSRTITALHGLFFVAGFSVVFVAIGLLSTAFIQQIGGKNISLVTGIIGRLGGMLIVLFGLHFMGILQRGLVYARTAFGNLWLTLLAALLLSLVLVWGLTGSVLPWTTSAWSDTLWMPLATVIVLSALWIGFAVGGAFAAPADFWSKTTAAVERALYSDTRRQMTATGRQGYAGSAMMGVVFSAGWTPCIGPVYGAVLTLAATGGSVAQAGTLLAAYSIGLGVPFLLTALMLDSGQAVLRRLQRRMHLIEVASGAFLVVIGLSVASGELQNLSQRFAGEYADFSIALEESVVDFVTGEDRSDGVEAANGESARDALLSSSSDDTASANLVEGLQVGNLAPDFQTTTDTGEPVSLADLRGQVVLLNFWATWCGPCRVEMPEFQQLAEQYAGQNFAIVAVNNGETMRDVAEFREEFALTFPLAMDEDGDIQSIYGIFSYPSTFILNQEGVIVARHFGALTADQIDRLVQQGMAS